MVPLGLEAAGFPSAFTERSGGVSPEPFASLDLSYSVGDEPARVAENRRRVVDGLGIPPFAVGGQVHGAVVTPVGRREAGSGFLGPDGVIPGTDGLSTSSAGIPLAVATADCVPVILASPSEGTVVVIHAGWRGVAAGIMAAALGLFRAPREVLAAIGPAARGCHYEVGDEVALAVSASTTSRVATERRRGKLYLDLPRTISASLLETGLRRGAIEDCDLCTICEAGRFYSHRREPGGGRQMAIAMKIA